MDFGFYRLFPTRAAVLQRVHQTVATVNRVFVRQIGVQLVVGEVLLMDAPGTWAWNLQPDASGTKVPGGGGLCGRSISDLLDEFTAWRREERAGQQGLFHLFTNCFPPPGTVGLSWLGGLCRNDIGTGVSSFSSTFWLTVGQCTRTPARRHSRTHAVTASCPPWQSVHSSHCDPCPCLVRFPGHRHMVQRTKSATTWAPRTRSSWARARPAA